MRNRHPFNYKHLAVIQQMLNSRTNGFGFVDVELTKEEKDAIQALLLERNSLDDQRYNLELRLDGEIERAKWHNMGDRGWATYERLKKVADQKDKDQATEETPEPQIVPPHVSFWAWVARWFLRGSPEGKALDVIEQRLIGEPK